MEGCFKSYFIGNEYNDGHEWQGVVDFFINIDRLKVKIFIQNFLGKISLQNWD